MQGGLILTVALMVIKLLGWLYQVQLLNILGGTGNGYIAAANRLFGPVYAITVTGFPIALSKLVSEFGVQGRYKDVLRTERVAKKLFLMIGIGGTVFLAALAPLYANMPSIGRPNLIWLIWACAPAVLFCCLMSVYRGYNQGMHNMTPTAVSQVVEVLFKVGVGIGASMLILKILTNIYASTGLVMGKPYGAEEAETVIVALAAAGAMLGISASAFFGWLYLIVRRWMRGSGVLKAQVLASPEPYKERQIAKKILTIAIPISLSAAAAALGGLIDNNIVIGTLRNLLENNREAVFASFGGLLEKADESLNNMPMFIYGAFEGHNKIATLISTITGSFGMSALPLVSAAWGERNALKVKKNIDASLRITMLLAAPMGFGIAFLAEPIGWFVYSGRPVEAAFGGYLLQGLGIYGMLLALMNILTAMLQAVGRTNVPMKLTLMGLVIKVITDLIFVRIPSVNIRGVVYSNLCCYGFICIMSLIILVRSANIRLNWASTLIKPLIAGFTTGLAGYLLYELLYRVFYSKYSTIMAIVGAVIIYVLMLGILRALEREDFETLPGGKKVIKVLEKIKLIR